MLRTSIGRVLLCAISTVLLIAGPLSADEKFEKKLQGAVSDASKELAKKIRGIVTDDKLLKSFVDFVMKSANETYGSQIAKLQSALAAKDKTITAKDREIVALEKKVATLSAAIAARPKLVKKPKLVVKPKPSGAFLGLSHVDGAKGAEVTRVIPGGPAASAGLAQGDVIYSLDGKPVVSANLSDKLSIHPVGAEVKLGVVRGGKKIEIVAKLVHREKFFAARDAAAKKAKQARPLVLGIEVEQDPAGVSVVVVDKGATANVLGIQKGDWILEFNGAAVKTTQQLREAVIKVKAGEKFSVVIRRGKDKHAISGIGASGKGAKLVDSKKLAGSPKVATVKPEKKTPKNKPAKVDTRKPAKLGVSVVEEDRGFVVESVKEGTGAAVYGVRAGDVIKKIAGKDIKDLATLKSVAASLKAGDKVDIVVLRGKDTIAIKDVLLGAEGEVVKKATSAAAAPKKTSGKTGFINFLAYEDEVDKILVVMDVMKGGAAEKAGLKPGDVILEVAGKSITSFGELKSALSELAAGQTVAFKVRRNGKEIEVKATLDARQLQK